MNSQSKDYHAKFIRSVSTGVTLVEVLIAVVVIGMVLSGFLTSINFAGKYARHNGNRTMALYFTQELAEELKSVDYDGLFDYAGYSDTVVLQQRKGIEVEAKRQINILDSEQFRTIFIKITWNWQGAEYIEEINTIISDHE